MKSFRLNRLFNPDSNRCFEIALDHGLFNERAFLAGIENIDRAIQTLALAGPDAIQLSLGQAPVLQGLPGKHKPALILRLDVANVYGTSLPDKHFSRMIADPIEQALRYDAACVVLTLFRIPDHPELTDQCIQNILSVKPACDRYGVPLMIEPLVFQANDKGGGYMVDADGDKIMALVRQATELGADIIKADPSSDLSAYRRIIEAARVPVLVRASGRAVDRETLERTEQVVAQGAAGIVFGRNILQHPDPAGLTRAVMAIVHERNKASDATRFIRS